MTEFAIDRNQISGTIPLSIFNISSLQLLRLHHNHLYGNLPKDIGNLTKLNELDISVNNLTGKTCVRIISCGLPREIGKIYQLEVLQLYSNSFTGFIPLELFNMSNLIDVDLSENSLSGSLPTNLGHGLSVLQTFYLHTNYLTGTIPDSITNCSKLRILQLALNQFTGFVPHFLGNLRHLEYITLAVNYLRTESTSSELSFITSLTNCRSLRVLAIGDNPLGGILPASIGNFSTSLQNRKFKQPCETFFIHERVVCQNNFFGPIPECLGNITSLRDLSLESNMLTSSIPSSIWRLRDLMYLDFSSNSLIGFLPPEIGNLLKTILINLSMNQFSESIPSTIENLISLNALSLAHNLLEGFIPDSVGRMISLISIDLSYNSLSGSIPKSFEKLQYLDYLNVSFNALRGEIPTGGPFVNFTIESFKGNDELCGIPRFNVPLCHHNVFKHRSRMKKMRLTLFIASGIVALILLLSLAFISVRYKRKHKAINGIDGLVPALPERISYYELLQATEHFSETNLIGMGGFGSVYKAVRRDGRISAVKVFNSLSEAACISFVVECEVLRNIRHRNLTKVISSCSNEDFKALVLEYMPNGNLKKWVYSHNYCLDLMQRLNIMIDVACALEYLHHGYSILIVHCDLKPSNVLLDEEMVAHVSDFGIAKLLGEGESTMHTNTLATMGYIAPEYGLEGLVSTRCDVYSYGVMCCAESSGDRIDMKEVLTELQKIKCRFSRRD
ncbi:PREDICTED: probable LRR receptor-like serine/threonine-protein kinase At3g47570 [Erythranthe guttata]|uniref:probable LRR receptor-like serine/threonine-protein kinase At3g47570 n=1 Tax=Erythranthe guttata TaxID=4155 RepID=UPI00064DCEFB|nr:PREDICTED: probable LRR receptor-like serine/threonine-protein kinase At3g47570 [Erythranthe guttata]|eukprot:XP_012833061.1 PREDICTED: probable LRR receptor-like serine/threonine-protein kinase At3g47570 [Erythranthe guttata]